MRPFVAVIGTINRDVIIAPDGTRRESLGGILYNTIPLACLLEGKGIVVRPVGRLGGEDRCEAQRLLAEFPSVDAGTLIEDPAGTNLSWLDYSRGPERVERVDLRVAPLSEPDLAAARGARACLVNMISGRDIERTVLAAFRRAVHGRFFLDVQALARTNEAPRRPRLVQDADSWSGLFHVVRGNETEIAWFGGAPGDPSRAAQRVLQAGAAEVIATRAEEGGRRFVLANGHLRVTEYVAVRCDAPADPTGCGDSFLAGLCAADVLGFPPDEALRLGAFLASRVAGLSGLASLTALRGVGEDAVRWEPAWARYLR